MDIKYSPATQRVANSEAWGDTDYVCSQYSQERRENAEKDWRDHTRCNTETGKDEFLKNVRDAEIDIHWHVKRKQNHVAQIQQRHRFYLQKQLPTVLVPFYTFSTIVCPNTNCVMWDKWCHRGFVWAQKRAQLSGGASIVLMSGPIEVAFICTLLAHTRLLSIVYPSRVPKRL